MPSGPGKAGRYSRVAARWLVRYLEAHGEATIDDAAFAVASLEAVAGPNNLHAVTALRDMAEGLGTGRGK